VLRRVVDLPISIYNIAGEDFVYRYGTDNAIVGLCSATANNKDIFTACRYVHRVREYSIAIA